MKLLKDLRAYKLQVEGLRFKSEERSSKEHNWQHEEKHI